MPFDLIIVLIASFTIFFIGSIVYYHDKHSVSNILLFLISVITLLWSITNYFSLNTEPQKVLFWLRLVLFFAVPHSVLFFLFIYNFPRRKIIMPKKRLFVIVGVMLFTMAITLTPLVFSDVVVENTITPIFGIFIPFFVLVIVGSLLGSMFLAVTKYIHAKNQEKKEWRFVLLGVLISYTLLIFTNFILVIFFDNTTFNVYGPIFMLPAVAGIAYAILRHGLLNVRVIGTEIIIFIILFLGLVEILLSNNNSEFILRIIIFVVLFLFSILLMRSVLNEVRQREQLEKVTKSLETANKKLKKFDEAKTEFLSITSHQLRTPLSSIKGYLSMILDGDFGKLSADQNKALSRVYGEVERLIRLVQVFLNVSRIESGRLKIAQIEFDMGELVETVVEQLKYIAEEKGLSIEYKKQKALPYVGDPDKLKDVVVNLIDNAIKYTEKGKIWIEVDIKNNHLVVGVHDTGIGIKKDYAQNLFEKFSRAKGIAQVDASGIGLGLFIVKKIIEGHHGSIRAESEGDGKGASFIFELPITYKNS